MGGGKTVTTLALVASSTKQAHQEQPFFRGDWGGQAIVILGCFGAILDHSGIFWPPGAPREAMGTQGGPGRPRGEPGKGYPGLPGGPLTLPWVLWLGGLVSLPSKNAL
jgi:hypothetical protein